MNDRAAFDRLELERLRYATTELYAERDVLRDRINHLEQQLREAQHTIRALLKEAL